MPENAVSEDLKFPHLLLSPDRWNEFQEKLEARCRAIILWEESIRDQEKDLDHYIKLFNLIDGLDCLDAFPVSIPSDMEEAGRRMILQRKRILIDMFKQRIEQITESAIRDNPAKSYLLAGMAKILEPQEMTDARAEYVKRTKSFYSFSTRPLKDMDEEAIENLARLGLIETKKEETKGTYETSSIIKIIVAVLEDQLGESVRALSPERKIGLVKGILEHASARPEGADQLIGQIAEFEAAEERDSASTVVRAFLKETQQLLHNATNDNLNAFEGKTQSGWEAIKFLEEHMEEGRVKDYLVKEIRTAMANQNNDPIKTARQKEKIKRKHLEEMIEKVRKVMGFTFDVSAMEDDYFIATVSHEKLGLKPISLTFIVSNVKSGWHTSTIENGHPISIIRIQAEYFTGYAYEVFFHELGHMYRNGARQSEDSTNRPYSSDGNWHELLPMFFQLLYRKKTVAEDGKLSEADFQNILSNLFVARLVLFRELCRDRIRSTLPLLIGEIAQDADLSPKIPHLSAWNPPNLGKYIFGTIAAENGLRIMDKLKPENQEEFLHDVLHLFMYCRDKDLGTAYYELLSKWEQHLLS